MQAVVMSELEEDSAALHDSVQVKRERPDREREQLINELYAEHEVKEEIVIGPLKLQQPGPSAEQLFGGAYLLKGPVLEISNEKLKQEKSQSKRNDDTVAEENVDFQITKPSTWLKKIKCEIQNKLITAKSKTFHIEISKKNTSDMYFKFHDEQRQHICETCSFRFETKATLQRHIKNCHSVNNTFESCGEFKTNYLSHFKKHFRVRSEENPVSCPRCHYKCTTQSNLKEHMRTHTGEKPFSYQKFSYICAREGTLKDHMRTHTSVKLFSCQQCHYNCTTRGNLKDHMRTHTDKKPLSCPQCPYICAAQSILKLHLRTHTGEKPFSCPQCSYIGSRQSNLKDHMRAHTGKKPFSCQQCHYKCTTQSNLIDHMRTHTGEKPFSCPQCSYICARQANLKDHMRTHRPAKSGSWLRRTPCKRTGEKPFSCPQCHYKCRTQGNLKDHMRTHTGKNLSHVHNLHTYVLDKVI